MVVDCGIDRRHRRKHCRALLVNRFEDLSDVETWQGDDLDAVQHRKVHRGRHREDMEERDYRQHLVLTRNQRRAEHAGLDRVGVQVRMRQHRALRDPGGSAGILQHRDVALGIDGMRRDLAVIVDQPVECDEARVLRDARDIAATRQPIEQILREWQAVGHGADDHRFQPAGFSQAEDLLRDLDDVDRHHDARAAVPKLIAEFRFGIERVAIDDDAAAFRDGEIRDQVNHGIRQNQSHAVPWLHHRFQPVGEPIDEASDLRITPFPVHEIEGRPIPVSGDRIVDQRKKRLCGDRRPPVYSLGIMIEPGPHLLGYLMGGRHSPSLPDVNFNHSSRVAISPRF